MVKDLLAIEKRELWNKVLSQTISSDAVVLQFLVGKLDLNYLSVNYQVCDIEKCIEILVNALLNTTVSTTKKLLSSKSCVAEISAANIPQFSNFATAAIYLPELLLSSASQLANRDLGYALFSETKSDCAAEKYGQNHGNLAVQLGLAATTKIDHKNVYRPSPLTTKYCQLEQDKKMELLQRLCFRIPIIQAAATSEFPTDTVDECMKKSLAKSTYTRRKSNVLELLAFALGE